MGTPEPAVTPLARAIELGGVPAVDDADLASRLHPLYAPAIARFEPGPLVSRGLPFTPPEDFGRRWIAVDRPIRADLSGVEASYLVLLAFCDAWRDERDERPTGTPVGWVLPVGEPLARLVVRRADGTTVERTVRRRFEVGEGIVGWGSMAFLAMPHVVEQPVDWRGPHPHQGVGRLAPTGHAGPLTILPGAWGGAQTGVTDDVPSATDDLVLWLHALDVRGIDGGPSSIVDVELVPLDGQGHGRLVVVAAMTAFTGSSSPLRWLPRRSLRVRGATDREVRTDLGLVARRSPWPARRRVSRVRGWGSVPVDASPSMKESLASDEIVEVTAAVEALLHVGSDRLSLADAEVGAHLVFGDGGRLELLAPSDHRVAVSVVGSDGRAAPSRVRCLARDGRYLPPAGHRSEVNPALYEDLGADVLLDGESYAYVPGAFDVEVPPDGGVIEVVAGMDLAPVVVDLGPDGVASGAVAVMLGEPVRPQGGGWVTGDTHVHFLSPSTALLQARAEAVNVVHLLATQWGDHHTSITDRGGDIVSDDGSHAVWVGSENRQNMLGHVGLVGTRSPILPFASGGAPEGPIGGPVMHLMADWLRRCRELGGLAVGAHFPLPMAEIAADIDAGLLDALEIQCFDPTLESPPIREWYRYLDAGYRLPLVGGTDKMSATVPLGQVRTWARLEDDRPLSFDAWARAVRGGRTFVTSGPLLELRVDGHEPGDVLAIDGVATVEVELVARAAQPVISDVEVVLDGGIVASESSAAPVTELAIRQRVAVERSGWLAGRCRSPFAIGSAFASAMAAHSSPVYLDHRDRPRRPADLGVPLALVDGTRAWLEHLAPVRDPSELRRFVAFLDDAERRLRERSS
jgi:hypothetical protein